MTILAIAVAALGAIAAFNRTPDAPSTAETSVTKIRRSTSVVLAIAEAIWTVLDALVFVTGRRVQSVAVGGRSVQPRFGQTASDAGD